MDGLRFVSIGAMFCFFALVQFFLGASLFTLFHPIPIAIVLGGTLLVLSVQGGVSRIQTSLGALMGPLDLDPSSSRGTELFPKWIAACGAARKEGLLALEPHRAELEPLSPRVAHGMKRLMDGAPPEEVLGLLSNEHAKAITDVEARASDLDGLGSTLNAFGLVSALLCLLPGLSDLSKLDRLSSAVQLSLVGLFWGSVLASGLVAPLRTRVEELRQMTLGLYAKEVIALKAIATSEHPSSLEERLK